MPDVLQRNAKAKPLGRQPWLIALGLIVALVFAALALRNASNELSRTAGVANSAPHTVQGGQAVISVDASGKPLRTHMGPPAEQARVRTAAKAQMRLWPYGAGQNAAHPSPGSPKTPLVNRAAKADFAAR